jgi:hypothetical protein
MFSSDELDNYLNNAGIAMAVYSVRQLLAV